MEDFGRRGRRWSPRTRGQHDLRRKARSRSVGLRRVDRGPLQAANTERTGSRAPIRRSCLIGLAAAISGKQRQDGMLPDRKEYEET